MIGEKVITKEDAENQSSINQFITYSFNHNYYHYMLAIINNKDINYNDLIRKLDPIIFSNNKVFKFVLSKVDNDSTKLVLLNKVILSGDIEKIKLMMERKGSLNWN